MYVNNKATLLLEAINEIAVGGPYHTPNIALFTNDMVPTRDSLLADFTIADFGGLTNIKAVTWGTPYQNLAKQAEVLATVLSWLTVSGALLPITAFGYVLLNTASSDWLLAERFSSSWTFNSGGPPLTFLPRLVFNT